MASLSARARAVCLALALIAGLGLPTIARADDGGGRVDPEIHCVGNPPRQTFDPLSPVCIPFWDPAADNGGVTAKGVTKDEIRVAVILEGRINYTSGSDPTNRVAPGGKVYDLAQSGEECWQRTGGDPGCWHLATEGLRVWQEYFNRRFQSYGRWIHFYAAYTSGPTANPGVRIADARRIDETVDPFAVVPLLTEGYDDRLIGELTSLGVLSFSDLPFVDDTMLSTSGLAWNFGASAQRAAATYTGFVCSKVVGKPAVRAGGLLNGQPRKLGVVATDAYGEPGRRAAAQATIDGVTACGGDIADWATFEECCVAHDTGDLPDEELQQMARFKLNGITTVLVPGAMNSNYFRAAQAIAYEPEFVLLGDGMLDNAAAYRMAADVVPGNTMVISSQVVESGAASVCHQAFREISASYDDADLAYVCDFYRPLWLMAVAIQLAGPTLSAANVDTGLHAMPARGGTDPATARCRFAPGEHTCVKDAHLGYWDPLGQTPPTVTPGCFRAAEGGKRYRAGTWPAGNVDAQWSANDPCGTYRASFRVNPL